MSEFILLLFNTAIINNLALTFLVGVDLQLAASRRINAAWLIGLATVYCLCLCLPGAYLVNQVIIVPLQLQYLDLLIYVMLILVIVLASQKLCHLLVPIISQQIDAVIPVLLINSVFLAAILLNGSQINSLLDSFIFGLGTGLGFLFLLLVVTCLRERIDNKNIPAPFRGIPILLVAMGILTMGLMGLAGL